MGSRKPSVVTSSTRGCSGQRARRAWRRRATVDLPTATEPADAYDERGAGLGALLAQERVEGAAQAVGGADVEVEEPGQWQIDVPYLVEVDDIAQAAQLLDLLGVQGQRRFSRSALHSARVRST